MFMAAETGKQYGQANFPIYNANKGRKYAAKSSSFGGPKNFGVNKQGQLVIDYSPNWHKLEQYITNLTLSE